MHDSVLDAIRNAAASGNLLVVTGAGISQGLKRVNGLPLPNWGQLVQDLRQRGAPYRLAPVAALLDELLPATALDKVHGDALIEASELIQTSFAEGEFEKAIAELCREEAGTYTDTHAAIAEIAPAGVITFNYDQGHEAAFERQGCRVEPIRYDEADKLKARLAAEGTAAPFLLKAHGCISHPPSLVLTSSSYRAVLSKNRAYRLFLQHAFARYSVLIVGFALRDRDFDQLLAVLEIELGRPFQTHAFIAMRPDETAEGLVKRADLAAVTARFGLKPLYVDEFSAIPQILRSLGSDAGSLVHRLVEDSTSTVAEIRARAHDEIVGLGRIGRSQTRSALLARLDSAGLGLAERSELLYAFRGIAEGDDRVRSRLLAELQRAADGASGTEAKGHAECAAHVLVVMRSLRIKDRARLNETVTALKDPLLHANLVRLDAVCTVPRLQSYAFAAAGELESRHEA